MKRSTDILLRIILVISILGVIFFYYYGKFITNKKYIIKSQITYLPRYPKIEKKIKPEKKSNVSTYYSITIVDYPSKSKIDELVSLIKKYIKNAKVTITSKNTIGFFKRVFVGPFKSKIELIKVENKLKEIGLEPLRVKLRGYYFLHCGSYYMNATIDELKNKLYKNGIKNLTIFKVKKKVTLYNLKVDNLTKDQYQKVVDYLKKNKIPYNG